MFLEVFSLPGHEIPSHWPPAPDHRRLLSDPRKYLEIHRQLLCISTTLPMDVRLIRRPIADLLSGRSQCLLALNAPSTRQESSYRRSKQRLNIKPHPSLLQQNQLQDHIIFNPPSSMPSVLHTPLKFLPKEDPRRPLSASRRDVVARQLSRRRNGCGVAAAGRDRCH